MRIPRERMNIGENAWDCDISGGVCCRGWEGMTGEVDGLKVS